jgi:hypothetical protein
MKASPYLRPQRLADVVAAIQVMGSHPWDSRTIEQWQENLGKDPLSKPRRWEAVFSDHPEFFGSDENHLGKFFFLHLRRASDQTVDANLERQRELSGDEIASRKSEPGFNPRYDLARKTLAPDQIELLLRVAIDLHAREIALVGNRRWWVAPLLSLIGAAIGAWGAVRAASISKILGSDTLTSQRSKTHIQIPSGSRPSTQSLISSVASRDEASR